MYNNTMYNQDSLVSVLSTDTEDYRIQAIKETVDLMTKFSGGGYNIIKTDVIVTVTNNSVSVEKDVDYSRRHFGTLKLFYDEDITLIRDYLEKYLVQNKEYINPHKVQELKRLIALML